MIAKLTGTLDSLGLDHAVVDVGGVGYLVYCAGRTLDRLGQPGTPVSLSIETHVREDHINLYGFADGRECELFRLLLTVQGVGTRGALALIHALGADGVVRAVQAGDRTALCRADGVGPKLATRAITELRERIGSLPTLSQRTEPSQPAPPPEADATARPAARPPAGRKVSRARGEAATADRARTEAAAARREDAVSALVNLGYGRSEAWGAVQQTAPSLGEDAGLAALIRAGLAQLSGIATDGQAASEPAPGPEPEPVSEGGGRT